MVGGFGGDGEYFFLVLVVVVDLGDRCLLLRRGLGGGLLLW